MRLVYGAFLVFAIGALAMAYMYTNFVPKREITDFRGSERVSIVLNEEGFEPRDIRVMRGTTVTFTTTRQHKFWPASNAHPSHDLYSAFDPEHSIEPGDAWSFTFENVGVWGFHDHVRSYFTGTIYVEE